MPRSDAWGPSAGRAAPSTIPPLIPTAGRLYSSEERAAQSLASGHRSNRTWTPDAVSNASDSSDEEQNCSARYASRVPPVKIACEPEADNTFHTTNCSGKVAYNAEKLRHHRRVHQFTEGRETSQAEGMGGSIKSTVLHRAPGLERRDRVSDVIHSKSEQQQMCCTASRLSSESSRVSETESELLYHRSSGAWLPRSAANRKSSSEEELLSYAEKYSPQKLKQSPRSHRRSRYGGSHESPSSAQGMEAAAAEPASCFVRTRGYVPQHVLSNAQLGLPETSGSISNSSPVFNASSAAVANTRYAQRATRAIQRNHSREVLAAVEKPRRNWERSLRSFQAALRMHSPTEEDGPTDATEEEMDRLSPDMNFRDYPQAGENTDEECGMRFSEEEAVVGYESDSVDEIAFGSPFTAGSACPRYKSNEAQRAGASCVLSRKGASEGPNEYDITLQKRLEMKARRRVHERAACMGGYSLSVERAAAEDKWDTGASGSSPERCYDQGRHLQQQQGGLRYVHSPNVDSPMPSQRCRQQPRNSCFSTSVSRNAEERSPFRPVAASHHDRELSTVEDLTSPLCRRRARRQAYLHHSAEMPGLLHSGRLAGRSNPTAAEKVRGRREREEYAAYRVPGPGGGLLKESRNHQTNSCRDVQAGRAARTEARRQEEASSSFDEFSAEEEDIKRRGEVKWEDQSLPIAHCTWKRYGSEKKSVKLPAGSTSRMESEGEAIVEYSGRNACQTLRRFPVDGSFSSNTRKKFPCQTPAGEQQTSGAETTEEDTMLLRRPSVAQEAHREQQPDPEEERKTSVSSPTHPLQNETDTVSECSSGPPSPRFGTPGASDEDEAEDTRSHHHQRDMADMNVKPPARELDDRSVASMLEASEVGSNSIRLGKAHTSEKEGNTCNRSGSDEQPNDVAGDNNTGLRAEGVPDKFSRSHSYSNKEALSASPRCLSQDGIETASTLTTASPRGEGSFFPASPLSSPPLRSVEEECAQPPFVNISVLPDFLKGEQAQRPNVLTRAATPASAVADECYAHTPVEVLPSMTNSPAALISRTIEGSLTDARGNSGTLEVAATPATSVAEKCSTSQEPCFISLEDQQAKLERLRGAYMAKFSEMQRSPPNNRTQGKATQHPSIVKSKDNTYDRERCSDVANRMSSCDTEDANEASSNSNNDTLSITHGNARCCSVEAKKCDKASTMNQNDEGKVLEKFSAPTDDVLEMPTGSEGQGEAFRSESYEPQKALHLEGDADESNSILPSVCKTVDEGSSLPPTGISASEDAIDGGKIRETSVSTATTKSRLSRGEEESSGSSVEILAAEDRGEHAPNIVLLQQNAGRSASCQKEAAEKEGLPSARQSTQEQQNHTICTADSCTTSPDRGISCTPMTSASANELEETKESGGGQSTNVAVSSTGAGSPVSVGSAVARSLGHPNVEEGVDGKTPSASTGSMKPKRSTAAATTIRKLSGLKEVPSAGVLQHCGDKKELTGQYRQMCGKYACRKGERMNSTAGCVVPSVAAIPPSVPKCHPRARASSISITSSCTSHLKTTGVLQQQAQRHQSVTENSSSNPIGPSGFGQTSHFLRTLLARERAYENLPYLPLHEDTNSWTTAIAAAISPSLPSFPSSTPTLRAASQEAYLKEAATQSPWSAVSTAARTSQESLFLRALLTPRAFSNFTDSCLASADDTHDGENRKSITTATSNSTCPASELKSDICGSATTAAYPLLAHSTETTPENSLKAAETAGAAELPAASQGDTIEPQLPTPPEDDLNDGSTARTAVCSTLLFTMTRENQRTEGPTVASSDSETPTTTDGMRTTANPREGPEESKSHDAHQEAGEDPAEASQDANLAVESEEITPQASHSIRPCPNVTVVVSTLEKDQHPQGGSPRPAENNKDTCTEGLEVERSNVPAEGSEETDLSPCQAVSSVIRPDPCDTASGSLEDVASQSSSHRKTERQSKSRRSVAAAGQVPHKERKQKRESRSTVKLCGRIPAVVAGGTPIKFSSRRSHSALLPSIRTRDAVATEEVSSPVFDGSVSSFMKSSPPIKRKEEQRMAALAAVANYLRTNDEAKQKKELLSTATILDAKTQLQDWNMPATAHNVDMSAADISTWVGQESSTFFHMYHPSALPETDGIIGDERRYCSTTAGCTGSRMSTSSFHTNKSSFNERISQPLVLLTSRESGENTSGDSRRSSTSSIGERGGTTTGLHKPKGDIDQGKQASPPPGCEIKEKDDEIYERECAAVEENELILQAGKKSREELGNTEDDKAYAGTTGKMVRKAGSGNTFRQAIDASGSLTPQTERGGDVQLNGETSPSDEQSEDEAADIRVQLRLLQEREQEQQQLLEATDNHVQRLHEEMEQLAQKNTALRQKDIQYQQMYQQQRTALAHAKLKLLALQALLPSWRSGNSFVSTSFSSASSSMGKTAVEQQQLEDLYRVEQQVAALRRSIHSRQLLFKATYEKLRISNEQLKKEYENYKEQTLSQLQARSNSDTVLERLSMQIEDVTAEASRKDAQLQYREQEILVLRGKLEELLQLLRPLKEALRASRQEAAQFKQALKETEDRLARKKQQMVPCSCQTEDSLGIEKKTESDNHHQQSRQIKNERGCQGEAAMLYKKSIQETEGTSVGVQTEISSAFIGICPSERELKLARALGRQKSLLVQLRQQQQTQTCAWTQQRTQLQQRVDTLQARIQQLEEIQNIIMEPDMPQSLPVVPSASHTTSVNNGTHQVTCVPPAGGGGKSNTVVGTNSCSLPDISAAQGATGKSEYLSCFGEERLKAGSEDGDLTAGSLPIVSATAVAATHEGEAQEEDEILNYVMQVLGQEEELCVGSAVDISSDYALSSKAQYELSFPIKGNASSDNSRISYTSTNTDLSTRSSSENKDEFESRLPTYTTAPSGKEATASEAQLIQRASSHCLDVSGHRLASPRVLTDCGTVIKACSALEKVATDVLRTASHVEEQCSWLDGNNHTVRELGNWPGLGHRGPSPLEGCIPIRKGKVTSCSDAGQFLGVKSMQSLDFERTNTVEDSLMDDSFDGSREYGTHTSRARRKVQELRRKLREQGVLS